MNNFNTSPVYPVDGNAFSVMGAAQSAMRKVGASKADIDEYLRDATSGDYDHLLQVTLMAVDLRAGTPDEDEDFDEQVCDYCLATMPYCECEECEECGDFVTDGECYSADLHEV